MPDDKNELDEIKELYHRDLLGWNFDSFQLLGGLPPMDPFHITQKYQVVDPELCATGDITLTVTNKCSSEDIFCVDGLTQTVSNRIVGALIMRSKVKRRQNDVYKLLVGEQDVVAWEGENELWLMIEGQRDWIAFWKTLIAMRSVVEDVLDKQFEVAISRAMVANMASAGVGPSDSQSSCQEGTSNADVEGDGRSRGGMLPGGSRVDYEGVQKGPPTHPSSGTKTSPRTRHSSLESGCQTDADTRTLSENSRTNPGRRREKTHRGNGSTTTCRSDVMPEGDTVSGRRESHPHPRRRHRDQRRGSIANRRSHEFAGHTTHHSRPRTRSSRNDHTQSWLQSWVSKLENFGLGSERSTRKGR